MSGSTPPTEPLPTTPEAMVGTAPTGAGASASTAVALSATEMAFITQATDAGLFALRMGQLAVERSTNSAVKSYAALLVTDQTLLNNNLLQLAKQLGVPTPVSLTEPRQKILDNLARTSDLDFDRQFVAAAGQQDQAATVELFERTGRETRVSLVRSFVLGTLPTLRAHLSAAEKLPIKG